MNVLRRLRGITGGMMTLFADGELTLSKVVKIVGAGGAPSRTYYGTYTAMGFTGTDSAGLISADSGATAGTGAFIMLTFATAFAAAPQATLTPGNPATAAALPYVSGSTTTDITFALAVDPGTNLTILLYYHIIG